MEFKVKRKGNENMHKYPSYDLALAQKFSDKLKEELTDFLLGVVVFGSSVRREATAKSDIDILVVIDDVSTTITEPIIEGYRLLIENLVRKLSLKLHITTMTMSSFWEHSKSGDPVVVNILRDGIALYDTGFFAPLQGLLKEGRVRPSEESIWRYYGRSPKTLLNSRWHILQATLDLYWAVIDSAHAALMRANQVPTAPEHVADLLDKIYVKQKLLERKYSETMRMFYTLNKKITHRNIQQVTGADYDKYYVTADAFISRMKKLIEKGKF
jgi:predicted nucleotidyltransferase/uncharacterized protein (UPF0332 family)